MSHFTGFSRDVDSAYTRNVLLNCILISTVLRAIYFYTKNVLLNCILISTLLRAIYRERTIFLEPVPKIVVTINWEDNVFPGRTETIIF